VAEEGGSVSQAPSQLFVGSGQCFEPGLHLGFKGGELGLVAALALFGEGLEGLALALVGLLAEGVTLLQDPDVELGRIRSVGVEW